MLEQAKVDEGLKETDGEANKKRAETEEEAAKKLHALGLEALVTPYTLHTDICVYTLTYIYLYVKI